MNTSINTLAQLQQEKKKLKMQVEVSKREFIHSFGYTKTQTKDFLLHKVALPAGALGLATFGINKMAGRHSDKDQVIKIKKDNGFFLKMIPIVLPLVRAYFSTNGKRLDLDGLLEKIIAPKQETIKER